MMDGIWYDAMRGLDEKHLPSTRPFIDTHAESDAFFWSGCIIAYLCLGDRQAIRSFHGIRCLVQTCTARVGINRAH